MEGTDLTLWRGVAMAGFALLVGCATGDNPGFSSSETFGSFSGGTAGGTAMDDGGGTGDTGSMSGPGSAGGSGSDGPIDPSGAGSSGDSGGPGDTTGNADGPSCVPSDEVCDGADNDCDGDIDEDDPGGGEVCDTGMPGVCADGVTSCSAGAILCTGVTAPAAESCDGLDNDCNGMVDEGNPEGGGACSTGMPGICGAGTASCSGGAIVCTQNQMAMSEVCNASDDDCDGMIDEGNPGGGGACVTGLPGICSAGTLTCAGGAVICSQNQAAGAEICGDGLDNDCDGVVDDGCGCPFGLCDTPGMPMVNGCDPCVSQVCAVDAFCCSSQWDSICVGEVATVCGQADCVSPACAHLVCVSGVALTAGCHQCVTDICAVDAFCCSNSWDGICVGEVTSVCGLTCP